jgi:acyl-coenzyme A synthetase/AMP-(fatty) acid ligase
MISIREIEEKEPLPAESRCRMTTDQLYRMPFTSGTIGNPKCASHSSNTGLVAAQQLNDDMEMPGNDVQLIYLLVGLNWGYLCLLQTVLAGCRRDDGTIFVETSLAMIQREQVTYIATAPASIVAMLNVDNLRSYDTSSLRALVTGAASAPLETIRAFHRNLKAHLVELFGMLETGFPAYTRLDDDPERVNGTIGRVAGHMQICLVGADNKDVPFGAVGELAIRRPSVHLGYLNNSEAYAQAFTADNWFRSGDLGRYVDDAGNIRLTGRSKEIINRGGKKFFPREVEAILYTHPKLLHATMIGIPDARLDEKNGLCLVPKDGATITLEEVVSFVKGHVADYKLPELRYVVAEPPMTGTGKVRRPILQQQVAEMSATDANT